MILGCTTTCHIIEANDGVASPVRCVFEAAPEASTQMIVTGRVIGQADSSKTSILINDGKIRRIGAINEIRIDAPHAREIACEGVFISPGFVNAHEHPPYSGGKPGPNVAPVYLNRYQWQGEGGGQYPEIAYSRVQTDAELYWIELRHLLAGTTTMAGNGAVPGLIKNVGSGDRNIGFVYQADMKTFPFPDAINKFADLPWPYDGASVIPELTDGASLESPYVPHVAEGTDKISRLEAKFFLDYVEENPGRRYGMIHAVGLSKGDAKRLQELDVTVLWSPRSNLALYGDTINLPHLIDNGARVALSTDWSYSGSYNMLESFRCAKHVDNERWENRLSGREIWRMSTETPAYALNLEHTIGTLKSGFTADLAIIRAESEEPYTDLITTEVSDIVATFVDGKLVSGHRDAFDMSELPTSCSNFIGDHFVCDDLSKRNFTWEQLLKINKEAVPLFEPRGQANCTF